MKERWCIGTISGKYLVNPEDVLDVYAQPAEAGVVRRCFDERPSQLLGKVLSPLPLKPMATQREHPECVRNGVCNVLLAYNIDTSQRHLQVTTTKTKLIMPVLWTGSGRPTTPRRPKSAGAGQLLRPHLRRLLRTPAR